MSHPPLGQMLLLNMGCWGAGTATPQPSLWFGVWNNPSHRLAQREQGLSPLGLAFRVQGSNLPRVVFGGARAEHH